MTAGNKRHEVGLLVHPWVDFGKLAAGTPSSLTGRRRGEHASSHNGSI